MFTIALTNPKGINEQAGWNDQFKAALTVIGTLSPANVTQTLDASLSAWEQGSGGLAADPAYQAVERYCIRQLYLWQIYAAFETQAQGAAVGSSIRDRAEDVVEETPVASRPSDLSFMEGANTVPLTLEHLRQVWLFYPQAVREAGGLESAAAALTPSPGFRELTALEANTDPAQAEKSFQQLLADNTRVRSILLGDGVDTGAKNLDRSLFLPPSGLAKGYALWVKSHTLLRPSISTWLGAVIPHDYDKVRCIFISPLGKPAVLLSVDEDLDFATIMLKIVQAARADSTNT